MNEHRTRNEDLAKLRRQFQQAVAMGQIQALDRMGRPLEVGDLVLLRTETDIIFTVLSVVPVLDIKAPVGLMEATLTVTFPLRFPGGQRFQHAVILAKKVPEAANPNGDGQEKLSPVGDLPDGTESLSPDKDERPL